MEREPEPQPEPEEEPQPITTRDLPKTTEQQAATQPEKPTEN